MKKTRLFPLIFAFFACTLSTVEQATAGDIDKTKAREVGAYFMASQFGDKSITADNMKLVYEVPNALRGIPAMYVFNTGNDNGFVIIAGSDCISPIVAYSTDGNFDPNNIPPNMLWWLNDQANYIAFAQNNELEPAKEHLREWQILVDKKLPYFGQNSKEIIRLTTSKWNQEPLYNSMCPSDAGGLSVTGCVATAMAQIMYYWKFPYVGKSQSGYTWVYDNGQNSRYLFADYSTSYYNFDIMVDELTDNSPQDVIDAVALLNYHCGVSVQMSYSSDVSGALSSDVVKSLPKYFKYVKDSIQQVSRTSGIYNNPNNATNPNAKDSAWVDLIKSEILKNRPVYYSGDDPSGGSHARHAFVCDGWNSSTGTMHFNWGWGGRGDSWCNVYRSKLNAMSSYVFSDDHAAIIGITPPADSINFVSIETVDNPFTANIYPNPASSTVTVSYNLDNGSSSVMQIFDAAGRKVKELTIHPASTQVTVPVDNFAPGIYVCRINGFSKKFVVK